MGEENGGDRHDNDEMAPLLTNDVQEEAPAESPVTSTTGIINSEQATSSANANAVVPSAVPRAPAFHRMKWFIAILVFDIVSSTLLLIPAWSWIKKFGGERFGHYTLSSSLLDLGVFALVRLLSCIMALLMSYCRPVVPRDDDFPQLNLHHPNGDKKSRNELEQEALEENFLPWFNRYLFRNAFIGEWVSVASQVMCIAKSLARMDLEIGTFKDEVPYHPIFWFAILFCAVLSLLEAMYLDEACLLMAKYSKERCPQPSDSTVNRTLSSGLLATPLLSDQDANVDTTTASNDIEQNVNAGGSTPPDDADRGTSDITADCHFKADWRDLLMMCYPDIHMIMAAFVFLLFAAIAQVYIPRFLGNILDSLAAVFSDKTSDKNRDMPMWEVPGFLINVKCLVAASVLAGVFAGARGSIFTVVGSRVNVRLRVKLMDSLLSQDIGFFDVTKTGEITSRLSSDTTLVGDQVSLNVNVFLRSVVQALGVLSFMFVVSWQLSIIAFVSVPLITTLSKWYGNYIRALMKVMQTKLADGNSVSEAALGSMSTVRAFDAAEKELSSFEENMRKYLHLTYKSAIAYYGFATLTTSLPELVFAVVVYYGGMLVRNGDMTSGQLVSFLLYLQSLSDAFATIGYVFSSLTQAVGAADKVFELLHRKPKMRAPTNGRDEAPSEHPVHTGILGIEATKTRLQRSLGRRPANAAGKITLENIEMYYPARPNRKVLDGLTLKIEPGSVVALVGQSGGGKSSVMSLIQHLYEPSAGRVIVDGYDVHELCPEWLSRHISIVSQEPTLFARSIKKNIMYGLEGTAHEPTDDEIEEAARLANAHSFIMDMPLKYDTEVGERGVQLSGGQKQRIAIARALVRKPKILLLDEATSALDAESEHLVQQAIDDMIARGGNGSGISGNMTVVIVAHRLSTVRSADRIFVIKEGKVVEEGTHTDLLQNEEGPYALLIKRQMDAQNQLENGPVNGAVNGAVNGTVNGTVN